MGGVVGEAWPFTSGQSPETALSVDARDLPSDTPAHLASVSLTKPAPQLRTLIF